jgi:CheY-like chemotaxis protein
VVTLYLPRAPGGEAPRETAVKDAVAARGGGESVLLVEDDPRVRQVVEANLRSLGYRVLVAADGREALDILNGPARIDLLLSDIVMPGGMNGRELAELAVRIRRGLRVLLASGYSGEAFHGTGGEQKFPLLRKPYRRHELASRLRELLDSRRRP